MSTTTPTVPDTKNPSCRAVATDTWAVTQLDLPQPDRPSGTGC